MRIALHSFHFISSLGSHKLCVAGRGQGIEGRLNHSGVKQQFQSYCYKVTKSRRVSDWTWIRTWFSSALFMKLSAAGVLITSETERKHEERIRWIHFITMSFPCGSAWLPCLLPVGLVSIINKLCLPEPLPSPLVVSSDRPSYKRTQNNDPRRFSMWRLIWLLSAPAVGLLLPTHSLLLDSRCLHEECALFSISLPRILRCHKNQNGFSSEQGMRTPLMDPYLIVFAFSD